MFVSFLPLLYRRQFLCARTKVLAETYRRPSQNFSDLPCYSSDTLCTELNFHRASCRAGCVARRPRRGGQRRSRRARCRAFVQPAAFACEPETLNTPLPHGPALAKPQAPGISPKYTRNTFEIHWLGYATRNALAGLRCLAAWLPGCLAG